MAGSGGSNEGNGGWWQRARSPSATISILTLVVAGFAAGIPSLALNLVLLKQAVVMGAPWGAVVAEGQPAFRATLAALLAAAMSGRLRPHIGERLSFADAPAGLGRLRDGAVFGKAVVTL